MRVGKLFNNLLLLTLITCFFASCKRAGITDEEATKSSATLSPGDMPSKVTNSSNDSTTNAGNGQGYGGGDGPLADARNLYIKSVTLLKDRFEVASFATSTACSTVSEPILCNYLIGITPAQKTFLQDFVKQNAAKMIALNSGETRIKFEFTSEAIKTGNSSDSTRDLAAKTALSNKGSIVFHEPSVKALSAYRQIALLAHEMGHKTYTNLTPSHYIGDTGAVGPFSSGLVFLDTLGAAISIYLAGTVGKTAVTFPDTGLSCQVETLNTLLIGSPYYQKPSTGLGGQISSEADTFLRSLEDGEKFTVTAWVRVFNDLPATAGDYAGETILSNIDNSTTYSGWLFGFGMFRLENGNFGAYVGGAANQVIDSGAALTPGIFHHIAVKRDAGKVNLYVDGVLKISKSAFYNDEEDPGDRYLSLIDSSDSGVSLGRAASNPTYCKNVSGSYHKCMEYFEGHIALASFYKAALPDSEIKNLATCAPNR